MNPFRIALPCAALFLLAACGHDHAHDDARGHGALGHGPAAPADDDERGPHRGRLLRDGDFALEVTIFEDGVPPQYRLYAYADGQPVPASEVRATIELGRLGGRVDRFAFAPQGEVLVGDGVVVEPHSFDVTVVAEHAGKTHRWAYASYEGRTTIPAEVAAGAGLTVESAGPARLRERLRLQGRIAVDPARHAVLRAAFPGPVREVRVAAGDRVRAGQVLAVLENRDSLRPFTVTAPIDGTVLARHTNVGDVASDQVLFEVGDLGALVADLWAFEGDLARLAPGQPARVMARGDLQVDAAVAAVLPQVDATTRTATVRVPLPGAEGRLKPGMAVQAEVVVAEREVPLAVRRIALQRFRDFTVVYARFGDTYEVRMLELGASDDDHVEVLGGLEPGTPYVAEQAFLVRADVEKSGASHDH